MGAFKQGRNIIILVFLTYLSFQWIGCDGPSRDSYATNIPKNELGKPFLFEILGDSITQITFNNEVKEGSVMNGFNYEYLYNGAGVSIADFNGDDLPDLFFAANLIENQLYINQGNMVFENSTHKSMMGGNNGFYQGSTVVDINADGLLDIYVCKSGVFRDPDKRRNELYVNQGTNADGIPIFQEEAGNYGLNLPHFSTQATFLDYDKDGDLDMFLLNHNVNPNMVLENMEQLRYQKSDLTSDRLFQNQDGTFVDVSEKAGIINDGIGFGLGIAVGDLNNDGWPDLVVGHDYTSKDRMYINQQDGTFKEVMNSAAGHISTYSMGNDIADFNNDGWLDFISVDMVSEDNYGIKASMSGMNPDQFNYLVDEGFHHQYMYNTFQLNNGVAPQKDHPLFSDISFLTETSNTDWSWGPLFFDMDNDGDKDLFVSNGIKRDFRNVDYIRYKNEKEKELNQKLKEAPQEFKGILTKQFIAEMLQKMPARKKENYFFENEGGLSFSKQNKLWTPDVLSISNGAAYADLDNDGDLDIVTNNMDNQAFVYRNNSSELFLGNYLKIKLKGPTQNTDGIGARVSIVLNESIQIAEQYFSRGFQSSVDPTLHFGLGQAENIDEVSILWPDGKIQTLTNIRANQTLSLNYEEANTEGDIQQNRTFLFKNVTNSIGVEHFASESNFDDFKTETLLPHKMSEDGPALALGDINNDGRSDFYIGGSKGVSGTLYLQTDSGNFKKSGINANTFEKDRFYEDVDAVFFDADLDGDQDLYVVSGSNEYEEGSKYYEDRVYRNDNGAFHKVEQPFGQIALTSGAVVKPCDFDMDGDMDLFVGGRQTPGKYPFPGNSYLLQNNSNAGKIQFTTVQTDVFNNMGMVTDAKWVDIDNDNTKDLIVVGEWMPIKVFKNQKGSLSDITEVVGLQAHTGWWFGVEAADFDKDGDMDLVVGNLGLNSKYSTAPEEPFQIFAKDFDGTGSTDIVLGYHQEGNLYPLRGRECSSNQMPFIKDKFPSYHAFASAKLEEVYGEENLKTALHYKANSFATTYFENLGNGFFETRSLPSLAQITNTSRIVVEDINADDNLDLILFGNMYGFEVETPRQDAGYGMLMLGDGTGNFTPMMPYDSGLYVIGDVSDAQRLNEKNDADLLLIAKKNSALQVVEIDRENYGKIKTLSK